MYEEFSKQYNEKILKAFGGGSIHHYGPERDWHWNSFRSAWLRGVNYGQPEMHHLENKYKALCSDKVAIIQWGMGQEYEFLDEVCRLKIPTGITLCCISDSFEKANEILSRHSVTNPHEYISIATES